MFKYELQLKPVVELGNIDSLEPMKQMLFKGLLTLISGILQGAEEVESVVVSDRYSLFITSKVDIGEMLATKIGNNTIVKKL